MDQLNRKHDLLAVRLWDPREADLPDVGVVLVEDSETGAQMSVDTSDRGSDGGFTKRPAAVKPSWSRPSSAPVWTSCRCPPRRT